VAAGAEAGGAVGAWASAWLATKTVADKAVMILMSLLVINIYFVSLDDKQYGRLVAILATVRLLPLLYFTTP
jgi:hypothetical protein